MGPGRRKYIVRGYGEHEGGKRGCVIRVGGGGGAVSRRLIVRGVGG